MVPRSPHSVYKDAWIDSYDWLGNDKVIYMPFEKAREFVWGLKLGGFNEWKKYCKSGNKPRNIQPS